MCEMLRPHCPRMVRQKSSRWRKEQRHFTSHPGWVLVLALVGPSLAIPGGGLCGCRGFPANPGWGVLLGISGCGPLQIVAEVLVGLLLVLVGWYLAIPGGGPSVMVQLSVNPGWGLLLVPLGWS